MKLTSDEIMSIIRLQLKLEMERCEAIRANILDHNSAHPDDTLAMAGRWIAQAGRVNVLENVLFEIGARESEM